MRQVLPVLLGAALIVVGLSLVVYSVVWGTGQLIVLGAGVLMALLGVLSLKEDLMRRHNRPNGA